MVLTSVLISVLGLFPASFAEEGEYEDLKAEVDFACAMSGVSNARIEVAFQVSRKVQARAQERGLLMRELVLGKGPEQTPRVDSKKIIADQLKALEFDVDVEVSKLSALQQQKIELEKKARISREIELNARKEKGEQIDVKAELKKPLEQTDAQKRNKVEIESQRARVKLATERHRSAVEKRAELETQATTEGEALRVKLVESYRTNKQATLKRLQKEHDRYTALAGRASRCYNEASGRTEEAVTPQAPEGSSATPPPAVPVQVRVPVAPSTDLSAPAAQ